ncbi:MAG: hypothetical protein FJ125_01045 [Deltaproteobacteria bacterium]|nr:hypothetical protein [Deltaproteobacteria bacterium]
MPDREPTDTLETNHPSLLLLQSLLLAAFVLAAAIGKLGCAPITEVKRSALTLSPAPPTSSGRAIGAGKVRLYGGLGPAGMVVEEELVTEVGDAGLWIPTQQALGGLRLGLGDHVDIGAKGLWTHYDWSTASTPGVAQLGKTERDAWAIGPTLTVTAPLGQSGLALGFAFETLWSSIPYASWQLKHGGEPGYYPYDPYSPDQAHYQLMEEGRENFLFFNWALLLNYRFEPPVPLTLFGGGGMHSTLRNIGFDNERNYESTLEKGNPVTLLVLGLEATVLDHLTVMLGGYWPLLDESDSSQVFGPAMELAIGLQL